MKFFDSGTQKFIDQKLDEWCKLEHGLTYKQLKISAPIHVRNELINVRKLIIDSIEFTKAHYKVSQNLDSSLIRKFTISEHHEGYDPRN